MRLFDRFSQGDYSEFCLLATGFGKTTAITIWLSALAHQINDLGSTNGTSKNGRIKITADVAAGGDW
jgi:hypothetical protein